MKILFVTHTFNLESGGGGEIALAGLIRELVKRGHEIAIFTPECRQFAEERELGLRVVRAGAWGHNAFHKYEYALQAGKAVKLAQEFNPDLVQAHNDVFPGIIADKIKKRLGIPYLLYVEYISRDVKSLNLKAVYWMNKFFIPKLGFGLLATMSKFALEKYLLKWGIPEEKCVVIPAGLDLKKFRQLPARKDLVERFGRHLIVSMKPLHSTNALGTSYLIKAMEIVGKKHPEYKLLVYGAGPAKKELEKLAAGLDLRESVHFLGHIPYSEVNSVYCSAEIIAHSLAFEATTSMAVIDSLACARPTLVTDIGEIRNAFGEAVRLAEPRSPESIAQGLMELIENPKKAQELAEKGRRLAEQKYAIERVADEWEKAYKRILKGKAERA